MGEMVELVKFNLNLSIPKGTMKNKQPTCQNQVAKRWASRRKDLETLIKADGQETKELGALTEYGLSLDMVEAGTFEGQRADFIRYQFSTGGPGDELRIYINGDVEYWFLDWFDGAFIDLTDDEIAQEIARWASNNLET